MTVKTSTMTYADKEKESYVPSLNELRDDFLSFLGPYVGERPLGLRILHRNRDTLPLNEIAVECMLKIIERYNDDFISLILEQMRLSNGNKDKCLGCGSTEYTEKVKKGFKVTTCSRCEFIVDIEKV